MVNFDPNVFAEVAAAGGAGALVAGIMALGVIVFLITFLLIYAYQAFAWMTIAKKNKYEYPWLAWIPFAATAMRLQLGKKFHWAWTFLWLIPIFGWIAIAVLVTISLWNIFDKSNYPAWLSLSYPAMFVPKISGIGTIAYLIIIGFVAWKKL